MTSISVTTPQPYAQTHRRESPRTVRHDDRNSGANQRGQWREATLHVTSAGGLGTSIATFCSILQH
jgi:hypothetical protein